MRGKAVIEFESSEFNRITPAYAGKRIARGRFNLLDQDHPRLCGEKSTSVEVSANVLGSPPPMRGKEVIPGKIAKPYRITPAYAGKSPLFQNVRQCIEDHPRLCGEKRSGGSTLSFVKGSPPPMRGKANALTQ